MQIYVLEEEFSYTTSASSAFMILLFSSILFLIYVTVQACSRSFSSLSLKSSSFNYSCSQLKAYGLNFTSHSELSSCSIESKASLSSMISLIIGQRSYSSSFNNYSSCSIYRFYLFMLFLIIYFFILINNILKNRFYFKTTDEKLQPIFSN